MERVRCDGLFWDRRRSEGVRFTVAFVFIDGRRFWGFCFQLKDSGEGASISNS